MDTLVCMGLSLTLRTQKRVNNHVMSDNASLLRGAILLSLLL